VQITSYNLHLGLLRSEHCWGEHRTVYSGRREADVVMTSIRHILGFPRNSEYDWSRFGRNPTHSCKLRLLVQLQANLICSLARRS